MSNDLNHRDDFDKLIQSSFAEQPVQADPVVWDNIAAAMAPKKKRVVAWWWYGAAASLALLMTAAIFFLNNDQSNSNEVPAVTYDEPNNDQNLNQTDDQQTRESLSDPSSLSFEDQKMNAKNTDDTSDNNSEKVLIESSSIAVSNKPVKKIAENRDEDEIDHESSDLASKNSSVDPALIAIENGENDNQKNESSGIENTDQPAPAGNGNSVKYIAVASAELDHLNLALMPTLVADISTELAVIDQLENRFMPWYDDSYPKSLEAESQNFLAANLTSGGSASSGFASSNNRFELSNDATPTSLTTGSNDEYSFSSDEEINYSPPFVLGVKGAIALSKRWYFESGLNYTFLSQKITSEQGFIFPTTITEHYLGAPLLFDFEFVQKRKLSMLASTGWQFEKGIASRSSVEEPSGTSVTKLKAPGIQIGWVLGLSTEYRINPQFGLYLQPSLTYWMYSSSGIQNVRNNSLIWPSLQMGLRYRID